MNSMLPKETEVLADAARSALQRRRNAAVCAGILTLRIADIAPIAAVADFPAVIELSSLDGSNGFVLNGIEPNDYSVRSVSSAGNVNSDGIDDLIVAAEGADPNGINLAGESYLKFGRAKNQDADGDSINDDSGNCTLAANSNQQDTDGDGIGNCCDADLNNECMVNFGDLGLLNAAFFTANADGDFNTDGVVKFF